MRTVYRDVDELSAAGVPVWAERGRQGGFQLQPGWRTRLDGLTAPEAQAMFLGGLPGPAAELGLGEAMASAQLKLLAALPDGWREDARRVSSRFHLDPIDWYRGPRRDRSPAGDRRRRSGASAGSTCATRAGSGTSRAPARSARAGAEGRRLVPGAPADGKGRAPTGCRTSSSWRSARSASSDRPASTSPRTGRSRRGASRRSWCAGARRCASRRSA